MNDGYIYFAKVNPGFIKIGWSGKPVHRVKSFRRSGRFPQNIQQGAKNSSMIGAIKGGRDVERLMHQKFNPFVVSGCPEWFSDVPAFHQILSTIELLRPESLIDIGCKMTTLQIPTHTHAKLKDINARVHVPIKFILETLVAKYLDQEYPPKKQRSVPK